VVAVLLGIIVLHERINWRTLAGGALIICGIGLIVTRRAKATKDSEVLADS
jgi:drug/metabolite transporter (DMT)-like permease